MQQTKVTFHTITEHDAGQRIDNFLLRHLKGIPKTRIYRIIRKGEVRVNKKRIKPEYKLQSNDLVRIPPVTMEEKKPLPKAPDHLLKQIKKSILFEDEALIAVNKPSGISVHGGSHSELGLIEILRQLRSDLEYLELVHRLDMETSGILLIAKSRNMLQHLHTLLREAHQIEKHYTTLVSGEWQAGKQRITHTLERKQNRARKVQVSEEGKESTSIFTPLTHYKEATLMDVQILTGRMHQIRTQLAYLGHPIIGDEKYGEEKQNRYFAKQHHSTRLFLHASSLSFKIGDRAYAFEAPLAPELQTLLKSLT
ncbi:RluA family pseudouridine synthase [Sulfurovum mangrovi]|uniref:RluA family pseudouridine synthase n=1 Tax=Sulfurovum mangrovi TaxID=2893889 RepID=UPI001E45C1E3|nr:RluA family pseudouridine synthase [Sulfurovum mangrovi]UFH59665.1 RluA family pseudouridine synthase [Sulfurovum mangrovi]UFH60811.1 RluA family pseudouridine synthase [Sulfurovum mangrovi]